MTDDITTIYRADWILPVASAPIESGALVVRGEKIAAVGAFDEVSAAFPAATMRDLGRAIVMPGFVNVHSHIEYTTFRGIIDDEDFGDWVIDLVDVKASLTPEEYLQSARLGAAECLASGVTTLADVSYTGVSMTAAKEAGLRGRVYIEVFGVDDSRLDQTMAEVEQRYDALCAEASDRLEVGIAPHAPYTASSRLYQAVAGFCRQRGVKVASHVAESKEELTFIRSGSGKFAHDFREKVGWERMLVQPYGVSPIKYLQQWGVFDEDFLAVHCVHANHDDIGILKSKGAAVAHCPKSNAKLGCGVAPLSDLLHQGIRVGLGTDSPASSNIMDMFDEMRTALFLHRAVERDVKVLDAERCVRMATLGGAEALGMEAEIGSLEVGKQADFIAVDVSGSHFVPIGNPWSALVYGANQDDVRLTCIAGVELYRDKIYTDLDIETVRAQSLKVRKKLQARVRDGLVSVGAAESGWWRTAPEDEEEKA